MHGMLNDEYPLNSHLVFTQNTRVNDDYKLFAADLYNLKLNTNLAVLSACETGTGELQKGEGVMSLSRAFTYAGCSSLVMSLWSIPEKSSVEVLYNFFKNLKKERPKKISQKTSKTPKDVALREAKLAYLENTLATTSHPVYWAGLVLTGNTEAMHFESTLNKLWWFLPLLIILFAGLFALRRYYIK